MKIPAEMSEMISRLHLLRSGRWKIIDGETRTRLFWWPSKSNGGPLPLDVLIEWTPYQGWSVYVEGASAEQLEHLPADRLGMFWPVGCQRPQLAEGRADYRFINESCREAQSWGPSKGYEEVGPWIKRKRRLKALYRTPWGFLAEVILLPDTGHWWIRCSARDGYDKMKVPHEHRRWVK